MTVDKNEKDVPAETAAPASADPTPVAAPAPQRDPRNNWSADATAAGRKGSEYTFEPRESAFFVERTHTLMSVPIQRAFDSIFERTAYALYEVDIILPIAARANDEAVEKMEALVETQFKKLAQFQETQSASLKASIDANGTVEDGSFSKGREIAIKIYSPRARRFLDLMLEMDRLVYLANQLYMASFMDGIEFRRFCFEARVALVRMGRTLWNMHDTSIRALRRVASEAAKLAAEATDHATREKARAQAKVASDMLDASEAARITASGTDRLGENELSAESGGVDIEAAIANQEKAEAPRKRVRRAAATA